jgi:hypothetical protein
MPLSDYDYNHHSTYFGVWSTAQAARVSELLESLGVRYEFSRKRASESGQRGTRRLPILTRGTSFGYTLTIWIR